MSYKISILEDLITKECFLVRFISESYSLGMNDDISYIKNFFISNKYEILHTVVGTKVYKPFTINSKIDKYLYIYNDNIVLYTSDNGIIKSDTLSNLVREHKLKQIAKICA